jgi:hypothetical protein
VTGLESQIIKEMEAAKRKTTATEISGINVKVTYVQGYSTKINEDGLKKALGAARWVKVTKMVVDKSKLETAMSNGLIDPIVVGQHVTQSPNKPYLRITESLSDNA